MGITPSHIPHTESRDAATHIVRALAAHGHIAYFAGGCVRDELLGLVPTDYDVATDAIPERIAELFPRTAHVGASFGVMLVKIGRVVVEVATFRADGEYSDKRRPDSVRFSTPEEDAQRRDFTVNALFLDPLADQSHSIIDHVAGLPDLAARVLRAVGNPDARLNEDHLRALRAVRLAAKLGFTIDPATAAAIRTHAAELAGVSRERIGEEVRRMLGHPSRARAAGLLRELALEAPVLALPPFGGTTGFPRLTALEPLDSMAIFPMALAAWILDLDLPSRVRDAAAQIRGALCLSNEDLALLRAILGHHHTIQTQWADASVAQQKRWASARGFAEALEIHRTIHPGSAGRVAARVDELAQVHGGLAPTPLVDGEQLLRLGLTPGPAFKVILDRVYDAQLEGHVRDLAGASALALSIAQSLGR